LVISNGEISKTFDNLLFKKSKKRGVYASGLFLGIF